MTDELIMLCAEAARVACLRMGPHHLKALNDSAEQASCLGRFEWDRKVTAHAEFFNLLADAAGPGIGSWRSSANCASY